MDLGLLQQDIDDWAMQEPPDDPEDEPVTQVGADMAGGWGHHGLAQPIPVPSLPSEPGPSSSNADERFEAGGDTVKAVTLQPVPCLVAAARV